MEIRTALPAELAPLIKSRDANAFDVYERLSRAGLTEPELCFLAEDSGTPKGALVLITVRSGEITAAYSACAVWDEEFTVAQLYEHACIALREKGIPFIFAKRPSADDKLYYERLNWKWMVLLGFVPPVLDNDALLYAGKCLDPEVKKGSCQPLELPPELGEPSPVCRFTGEHCVDEEQLAKECYTTRERRRLAERAAIVIFLIALIVIGFVKDSYPRYLYYSVPVAVIGLVLLYRNIFRPKKVVAEVVENFRKSGRQRTDDRYFFGEDTFICFTDGKSHSIRFYSGIKQVYVKPEFIFLLETSGENSATGFFVSNSSFENKQAFLDHIRAKSPEVIFKR